MVWEIQPQPEPTPGWTWSTRGAWIVTLFAQLIWFVPVSSAWVIPFGVAGLVALTLGSHAIYQVRMSGGPFTARLAALPASLAGAAAAMKLLHWHEKYS